MHSNKLGSTTTKPGPDMQTIPGKRECEHASKKGVVRQYNSHADSTPTPHCASKAPPYDKQIAKAGLRGQTLGATRRIYEKRI